MKKTYLISSLFFVAIPAQANDYSNYVNAMKDMADTVATETQFDSTSLSGNLASDLQNRLTQAEETASLSRVEKQTHDKQSVHDAMNGATTFNDYEQSITDSKQYSDNLAQTLRAEMKSGLASGGGGMLDLRDSLRNVNWVLANNHGATVSIRHPGWHDGDTLYYNTSRFGVRTTSSCSFNYNKSTKKATISISTKISASGPYRFKASYNNTKSLTFDMPTTLMASKSVGNSKTTGKITRSGGEKSLMKHTASFSNGRFYCNSGTTFYKGWSYNGGDGFSSYQNGTSTGSKYYTRSEAITN